MSDLTTIPLEKKTRDRLRKYGFKGKTWNELLIELMDEVDSYKKNK